MRPFKSNVLFVIIASLFAITASGQDSPKQSKSAPNLVVKINLMVLDEANHFVAGISQSDIRIFEDGVEQKTINVAAKDQGTNVVLVMDNTGSVRDQLEQITAIGKIIGGNLGGKDESLVIRFVGREHLEIVQPWTNDISMLNDAMDNLFVEGGQSALIDAIYLAGNTIIKREKESKQKRHAIVVVTDGEERNSYYNLKQLLQLFDGSDSQIFPLILTQQKAPKDINTQKNKVPAKIEMLARSLATRTGGETYFLPNRLKVDDIVTDLKPVLAELRSQYLLSYTSTNQTNDGHVRKLTVEIAPGPKGEKRRGIVRDNVIIPIQ